MRFTRGTGRRERAPAFTGGGLASTIALGVVTVVTAAGMGQLFEGVSYLAPLVAVAVVAHGVAFGLRRSERFPSVLVGPACIGAVVLVSTWAVFFPATAWGIPDGHTFNVIGGALVQARVDFATLRAPVPATPGFVWLAALAIGAAGTLADTAAFGLGATMEGVLPAFALFLFTAGLGTSSGRSVAVGTWVAAVLAYLLVSELERGGTHLGWLGGRVRRNRAVLSTGSALGLVAVIGAVLVGPQLPGAHAMSLLGSSGASKASQRTTISPLVNIRAELLAPSTAKVFDVSSPVPAYWRLTSLGTFNGTTWSSDAAYGPVGEALPSRPGPEAVTLVPQVFDITGLSETWLPAAYLPVALGGVGGAGFNAASASIIAGSPTYNGLTYTVTSEIPSFTPAELSDARIDPSAPGVAHDLALPSTVPASVRNLARRVTAGATTPYAKALALQDYLRNNFTYSLNVPPSNSDNALVSFLFHTRAGYCQQFAGAYAVMARVVGLPTRIAVGFTPGVLGADGLYHVEAFDAHAWPEVDLGQYGWVAFEPTPGRGQPGATNYTGVAPAQAKGPASTPPVTAVTTHNAGTTPATSPPTRPRGSTTSPPLRHNAPQPPAPARRAQHRALGILALVVLALACLVGLVVLCFGALVALASARRRRRWAGVSSDPAAALAAYADACEVLAWAGRPRHPAETFASFTRRVAPGLAAGPASDLVHLAACAEHAAWGPSAVGGGGLALLDARGVREMAARFGREVRRGTTLRRQLAWWSDARHILGRSAPEGWAVPAPGMLVRDALETPVTAARGSGPIGR